MSLWSVDVEDDVARVVVVGVSVVVDVASAVVELVIVEGQESMTS